MPEPVRYTAGQKLMDGYQIMNHVQKNQETAIVRDLEQSCGNGPVGEYYDAYHEGHLIAAFRTEAEATQAIQRARGDRG